MANYRTRKYGEGRVWRDENRPGTWRGRVMVNGERRMVSGTSQGEVEQKLDALRDALVDGDEPEIESPTLGAWLALWVKDLAPDASDNTVANRRWAVTHLRPLAAHRLDALRVEHVEALLATKDLKRSSLERIRTVLNMALKDAQRRRMVDHNIAPLVRIPKAAAKRAERRALSAEEAANLLDAAEDDPDAIAVVLGLRLGLRPGEVCGLRWDDVDLDAGTLTVARMRRREPDGSLTMTDPKADSGRTFTGVPEPVLDALRAHKAAQGRRRLASRGTFSDHGLVWCNRNGTPVDPSNHRRAVERMAAAAGIFGGLSPNELRHTFATRRVAEGRSLTDVAVAMGHANERMMIATYNHPGRVIDMGA